MLRRFVLGCALAVIVCLTVESLLADDKAKDEKPVRTVIVTVDGVENLQMTTKKPLRSVTDEKGQPIVTIDLDEEKRTFSVVLNDKADRSVIRLTPAVSDPTTILIFGRGQGKARFTCVDNQGTKETYEIVVRPGLIVLVDESDRAQLSSKKPIAKIVNETEKIIRVQPIAKDPTTVSVTGLTAGDGRFSIVDADGKTETYEVSVCADKLTGKNQRFLTTQTVQLLRMEPGENGVARLIDSINNSREDVLQVIPAGNDPTAVYLIGRKPGFSRIGLTTRARGKKEEGKTETYEIVVRADGAIPKDHKLLTPGQEYRLPLPKSDGKREISTSHGDSEDIKTKLTEDGSAVIVSCSKEMGFIVSVVTIDEGFRRSEITQFFTVRKEKPQPK